MFRMKILVVEDDQKINSFLCRGLKESGYNVVSAENGMDGLDLIQNDQSIDLVVLDIMLPRMNGLDVMTQVRKDGNGVPIIILSAKNSVDEKITGLQHGADDYLSKPFSFSELLARIQALLRRNQPVKAAPTTISKFGISMDLLTRKVTRDGTEIDLQAKEFNLLEYFLRHPERAVSKTMILENVYGYDFDTRTNVVDVLVCRLRNKVDKDFNKKTIHTLRGIGYVLKED